MCIRDRYILTLKNRTDGVYSLLNDHGEQVIPIFEEQDDANRYHRQLEEVFSKHPLEVVEIDLNDIVNACEERDQKYAIITEDDFIIPPSDIE